MNKANGYVLIHRQIVDWEWYTDVNTKLLFFHLVLIANFKDTRFLGKKIRRGQIVTSLPKLAEETGLSVQNVRTAIKHLISTGEITYESKHGYRIITVVKYDEYQISTDKLTDDQQATNRRLTGDQQHQNKGNTCNKRNKENQIHMPPSLDEVKKYIEETGSKIDPVHFYNYNEERGWTLKSGQKIKNWKLTIQRWEERDKDGHGRTGEADPGKNKSKYAFLKDRIPMP
jgi:biotin operon repressor